MENCFVEMKPLNWKNRLKMDIFLRPHVFENLSNHCRTNQEEIFGPVASLNVFKDEKEAIALANESEYGLASSIWTNDLSRTHRIGEKD